MKIHQFLAIILFIVFCSFNYCNARNKFVSMLAPKQVLLKNVRQCEGKDDLPVYISPLEIVQEEKYKYYTNGEVIIKNDYPKGFKANIDVKSCQANFNLNKCTTFLNNLGTDQLCDLLKVHSDAYSPFLDKIEPRPRCPLAKGTYKIERVPLSDSILRYVPILTVSHWHINITGFFKEEMVACFVIQLSITPKRE